MKVHWKKCTLYLSHEKWGVWVFFFVYLIAQWLYQQTAFPSSIQWHLRFWTTSLFCFSRISLLGEYLLSYCNILSYLHSPADNCAEILGLVGMPWGPWIVQSSVTGSSLTTLKWQIARGWLWNPHNNDNYVWLGLLIMEKLHCPSTPGLDKAPPQKLCCKFDLLQANSKASSQNPWRCGL